MKNKLIILVITICIVFQLARLEGYGYVRTREGFKTTAQREAEEHVSDVTDNADLTEQQEKYQHRGDMDNAQITGQVEKIQHRSSAERNIQFTGPEKKQEWRGDQDHARLTTAAEKRQHIANVSDNARLTSQYEQRNRFRAESNASETSRVEAESRQPQR